MAVNNPTSETHTFGVAGEVFEVAPGINTFAPKGAAKDVDEIDRQAVAQLHVKGVHHHHPDQPVDTGKKRKKRGAGK